MASTALAATPVAQRATVATRRYAPGLDGVRALAVIAVVVFHATPDLLPGGYLGVDVFFVVSGFLITTLILREGEATGRILLPRFWLRRARRLVPGLVLMVTVVAMATLFVGRDTAVALRSQVVGALTWSSNWVQGVDGQSYVEASQPLIFTHLWSLAVEEQFYLLWPPLLVALLLMTGTRRTTARVVVLLAVVSALAMWTTATASAEPTGAYMFTHTHTFGLLLGAGLALSRWPSLLRPMRPHFHTVRPKLISLAAAVALGFLGYAALTMEWTSTEPLLGPFSGGLLLVSVATVVVLVAACNETPLARVLANPVFVWLGRRSYGLYLWHWPLVVFAVRVAPADLGAQAAWAGVALAVLVCAASYRFVEVPIRHDGFKVTLGRWFGRTHRLRQATAVAVAVLAAFAVGAAPRTSALDATLAEGGAAVARSQETATLTKRQADVRPAVPGGREGAHHLDRLDTSLDRTVPEPVEGLDQPVADQPGREQTASCRALRNGRAVSAFGDSVLVSVAPTLLDGMPRVRITAEIAWQLDDVAAAVRSSAATGTLREVVVIATGTNGAVPVGDLRSLVRQVRDSGRRVVLVTPYVPRSWGPTSISAIEQVAAAEPRVRVADWHDAIAGRTGLLAADHIHPVPRSARIYASVVEHAVEEFCSPR